MDQALADAKKQWDKERERDIQQRNFSFFLETQQWISERSAYELKISRMNYELSEYKQKLDLAVSETLMFQKHAEDSQLDYLTKMKTLREKYNEQIVEIAVTYDRQLRELKEKLTEMYKQSAASLVSTHCSVANLPQSFQRSDLLGKLHILEKIMKEKDAKLRELEEIVREKKEVVLKKVSGNNHVADSDGSVTDFECYHGDLSEASPEKLRDHIKKLESVLHTMKQKFNREVSVLTQQHQKESEISVRLRGEEFQAELQYFLKEKEDQWKTRMETTVKQHEQALKQVDEKHKCVLRKTIYEYEHKNLELQKIIDEYNKFRSDKEMKQGESTCVGDTFSLRDKMKDGIVLLEEKYITEKATLERKVKQTEEVKGDEIMSLCLCQSEDARKLKETFDAALSSLKAEHHNVIRQLEQELDKAHELAESFKKENECDKLVVEQLQKEVEWMKVSSSDKQVKEQREKWLLEAQAYINTLIKHGVEDHIKNEEGKIRERLEKLNGAEERMIKQLEKMNEEEEKMRKKLDKIKKEERMKKEQENIQDTHQWISERSAYELKMCRINDELIEYKQKLDLAVSVTLMFQKQAEDSKLDYQTKMKTLTEKYKEAISDIVVKYDRQMREFEEKQAMYNQSAASLVSKHGSVAHFPQSFQVSDLPGKLHILEKIMKEKDEKLRELEKIIEEQTKVILKKISGNHNHVTDSECYQTETDATLKVPHSGPRSVTSLKSQVHHLGTGDCIPAEKLAHPCSASSLMPVPVIGTEEIDILKVHAIRSVLSQKVPEGTITALEYSLDELSEHVTSLVARASSELTRLQ